MSTSCSWLFPLSLVALFPAALVAQSNELPAELTPMTELDWGDGPEQVDRVMTDLGFHFWADASAETTRMYTKGSVLDHPASMVTLMERGGVALVMVQLHPKHPLGVDKPTRELLATYRRVVRLLSMRYGPPDASVETYQADRGFGDTSLDRSTPDTMAAIEEGRADLIDAWEHGSMVIGVEMIDAPTIVVSYEGPDGYGPRNILERARSKGRW